MNDLNQSPIVHDLTLETLDGKKRVVITNVYPEIDCGRYAVKKRFNETVFIEADIFADGHDKINAFIQYQHESENTSQKIHFRYIDNDRWQAAFTVNKIGRYTVTLHAYVDIFDTWCSTIKKKFSVQENIDIDLQIGVRLLETCLIHCQSYNKKILKNAITIWNDNDVDKKLELLDNDVFIKTVKEHLPHHINHYPRPVQLIVDRDLAYFSAWYEVFPRSLGKQKKHGTFKDLSQHLNYIKELGFNVVYLPPIHPIGLKKRKGKNNALTAKADDPGSPWAIGSVDGGHMSIHPELGTMQDFLDLVATARRQHIEIALDIALQCSPDHPYLESHRNWFKIRTDGSLQYAENPPKKYEDIYPFNFDSNEWKTLWQEVKNIFLFWIEKGITIFRIDNPHTKPFLFWEWLIREIKKIHPEVIFLAEAFTRPKVMYELAKLGFTQSYTYFTWKNTKKEITDYFEELVSYPQSEYFIPNLFINTPDILHEYLQINGKPAFIIRLILGATLGSNYGIYGPVFELCMNQPIRKDSEEYLDSEKYEIKEWQFHPDNIIEEVKKMNRIRTTTVAIQNMQTLKFHETKNENIICYTKHSKEYAEVLLVIVNLDPKTKHAGLLMLDLEKYVTSETLKNVYDVWNNKIFAWKSNENYIELDPADCVAHIIIFKNRNKGKP